MTISMIATVTWPRLSRRARIGAALSAGRVVRATPIMIEKKMTASMSPSAAAFTGLRGTTLTRRSIPNVPPERPMAPSACPR